MQDLGSSPSTRNKEIKLEVQQISQVRASFSVVFKSEAFLKGPRDPETPTIPLEVGPEETRANH